MTHNRILLIGASGSVGTAIEEECYHKGIDCIGPSHQDLDICDDESLAHLVNTIKPNVVINTAVLMGINPCEENPQKAFAVNTTAVARLAKICAEKDIVLCQTSTHAVFDGGKDQYYTETDIPNPINIYGGSKYLSECFTKNICAKHYIIRFPTLFGPRRNDSLGFVDKTLKRIRNGETLQIADDKIDSLTYTRDAAKVVLSILIENENYGTYHISNAGKISYFDFVLTLVDLLGEKTVIHRAKDSDFPALGKKPLKTAFTSCKLNPLRSWQEALKDYLDSEITNVL